MNLRLVLSILLTLAAAGLAAFGVLSLGGSFSDRLDVLTHFAPLVLAAAACLLLLNLVLGRGRARLAGAIASGAALLSSGLLVAPELAAAARPETPVPIQAERLRLLQFNILWKNEDPQATADYILRVDADVVFLEEAHDQAAVIPSMLRARYPHQVSCTGRRSGCGTRVLAKHAPLAVGHHLAPHDQDGSLGAAWITLPLSDGGAATFVGTHFTWPVPAGPQQAQSRALARILQRFPSDNLVVAGDFNSTPWSFSLRRQDRAFGLERRTRALFTWPRIVRGVRSPVPLLAIDHVYAGRAWSTVSVQRGPRTPSDHYPVIVELARSPLAAPDS